MAASASGSGRRESTFLELCDRLSLPRAVSDPLNELVNSVFFFNASEAAFGEADADKSGMLERNEYKAVAQALLEKFKEYLPFKDTVATDEDVDSVLTAFDTNKDGKIDPTEMYMVAKMLVLLRTYQDFKFKQANRPEIAHVHVEGVIDAPLDAVWARCGDFYNISFLPTFVACEHLLSGERKVSVGNPENPVVSYEKQDVPAPSSVELPWKKGYAYVVTNDPDPKIQPGTFKGNILMDDAADGKTHVHIVTQWVSPNAEDAAAVKAYNIKFFNDTIENVKRLFRH